MRTEEVLLNTTFLSQPNHAFRNRIMRVVVVLHCECCVSTQHSIPIGNFLLPTNHSKVDSGTFITTSKFFQILFFVRAGESFEPVVLLVVLQLKRVGGSRLNKDRLKMELKNLESIKTHPRRNSFQDNCNLTS